MQEDPPGLSSRWRSALFLVAGLGIGLPLGLRLGGPPQAVEPGATARATPAPSSAPTPRQVPTPNRRTEPRIDGTRSRQVPSPEALKAALALTNHELRALARSLAAPSGYKHVRALLADLAAHEAGQARRKTLLAQLGADAAGSSPPPPLPAGLRRIAGQLVRSETVTLDVVGAPAGLRYLSPLPGSAEAGAGSVLLDDEGPRRRVTFRTRDAQGVVRVVEVESDLQAGRDQLRVSYLREGRLSLVRRSTLGVRAGETFSQMLALLFARGAVAHATLRTLVEKPTVDGPRVGWLDWLRRDLSLPTNPDLVEQRGPPPPLPAANPLLLSQRGQPTLLNRPDLEFATRAPSLPRPARGPLVLIARDSLGVYDGGWSLLVFDATRRRVVQRGRGVEWAFRPVLDPDPARAARQFQALAERARSRTRQAFELLALRRDIRALEAALRGKVGGMYSRDGLAACRLREEILQRYRRRQALSHLLLDGEGARAADRALKRAKRDTVASVVAVLEGMIDAGRSGPVEYLLRDPGVKQLLFKAPQAYRQRLVTKFQRRFRPWATRVRRSVGGQAPHWYDTVRWFKDD